jgi:adhesin/invasin
MGDFESARRARARTRSRVRALALATLAASALIACGRTQGLSPPWQVHNDSATASGGALAGRAGAMFASRAGGGTGGQTALPGQGGIDVGLAGNTTAGALSVDHGGTGGDSNGTGASGMVDVLSHCPRAISPNVDGPLALDTQNEPQAAVSGDWNRDGKLDLAMSNSDGSVSVLFGLGDGSFEQGVAPTSGLETMPTETDRSSIATLDLDENGTLDLAVTHSASAAVAVLLGAADGTFAVGVTYPVQGGPRGIALGDFNGDHRIDLSTVSDSGQISVLLGHGDTTFSGPLVTYVGDQLESIAARDLNHDGRSDIVTLGSAELTVLLSVGDGRFVESQDKEVTRVHDQVVIDDFDADGDPDLALGVTCYTAHFPQGSVEVWRGHGDGTFSLSATYPIEKQCIDQLIVADVDGNGSSDLVTSPTSTLLGNGDGTFRPQIISAKTGGGNLLALGDWSTDRKPDLATSGGRWVRVQLGQGNGAFGSSEAYTTLPWANSLALADLNRDGVLDAFATTTYYSHQGPASSSVSVLLGAGNGTFLDSIAYETSEETASATAVELNGDGWLDFVTWDAQGYIGVLLGTGNGAFAAQTLLSETSSISPGVGDLNGDSKPDLVVVNQWTKTVGLLLGSGDGTFAASAFQKVADVPRALALFDANGDAMLDIALLFSDIATLGVLLNNGDGSFTPRPTLRTSPGHQALSAVDLNADGAADLVTWGTESASILSGSGDGSFVSLATYAGEVNDLVAIDFDKNGTRDLVTSTSTAVRILFGVGDGTFSCDAFYATGLNVTGVGVGDLNHDGRLDVATTASDGVQALLNATP